MPATTRDEIIVDAFWRVEVVVGYENALRLIAIEYGVSCADVERIVTADDRLDNGNC